MKVIIQTLEAKQELANTILGNAILGYIQKGSSPNEAAQHALRVLESFEIDANCVLGLKSK